MKAHKVWTNIDPNKESVCCVFLGSMDSEEEQQWAALVANVGDKCWSELWRHVVPFWLSRSHDESHGGWYTCLDDRGEIVDTDKYVWLQGRQLWFYSHVLWLWEREREKRERERERERKGERGCCVTGGWYCWTVWRWMDLRIVCVFLTIAC